MRREKLYSRRKLFKLTHAKLAEMAGIDRTAYTRIECGNRNPSVDTAIKIAQALGCTVEDIFLPSDVTKEHNTNSV